MVRIDRFEAYIGTGVWGCKHPDAGESGAIFLMGKVDPKDGTEAGVRPGLPGGFRVFPGMLDRAAQEALLAAVRGVADAAPVFSPVTPYGKPMRVKMTSAGAFGWVSDRRGYRYSDRHPAGSPWPAIPEAVLSIWKAVAECARLPECCLVNFYGEGVRMGLHQDRDETDFSCPVLSVSLGDEALFRIGGPSRSDPTRSLWLRSGDVAVMGGASRLAFHGIDRIVFGSSDLLRNGGRVNLTLRVVT